MESNLKVSGLSRSCLEDVLSDLGLDCVLDSSCGGAFLSEVVSLNN